MLALRIAVFLITLCLGIIASSLGRLEVREEHVADPVAIDHTCHPRAGELTEERCWKTTSRAEPPPSGSGSGDCSGSGTASGPNRDFPGERARSKGSRAQETPTSRLVSPLKIVYKEKARYTAEVRSKGIEGTVTLRVTFLASGGIGSITTIRGLPCGLTENAVEAARKMRFEPERVDGVARTTSRPVTFTFNIY